MKTQEIPYTLEQFMMEQKHREDVVKILDKIQKVLDKLDYRVSQLEKVKK